VTRRHYDPFDYVSWPEEQRAFVARVLHGMLDGEFQPLADYLRAGHHVIPAIATAIANCLERKHAPFYLYSKGAKSGAQKLSTIADKEFRKMQIAVFYEHRVRMLGPGASLVALQETCERFGISQSTAKTHRRALNAHVNGFKTIADLAVFEALKRTYLTDAEREGQWLTPNTWPKSL
jgi:hypothetical protein